MKYEFENAFADVFQFDNGTEVCEYHAMIHAGSTRLTYAQQLEAIMDAYSQLIEGPLSGAQAVFKRCVISSVMQPIRPMRLSPQMSQTVPRASSSRHPSTERRLPFGSI